MRTAVGETAVLRCLNQQVPAIKIMFIQSLHRAQPDLTSQPTVWSHHCGSQCCPTSCTSQTLQSQFWSGACERLKVGQNGPQPACPTERAMVKQVVPACRWRS